MIFKQVFWHTIEEKNLYDNYPLEYYDTNHYGPFFSIVIAPFALLPTGLGVISWGIANVAILYYAIIQLPISDASKKVILLISLIETLTAIQNEQVNPIITATIVLAYVFVKKNKEFVSTGLIIAGTMVKLYSIVGLAFIFFSKDRKKYFLYCIFWSVLCFVLPMLISNPSFIIQSYEHWCYSLVDKHAINIQSYLSDKMQDISAIGFVRRITRNYTLESIYFLIPAAIFSLIPLTRLKQLRNASFQLNVMAQLLIGVVIFSSSAESSTYIIAVTGFAIWYVTEDTTRFSVMAILLLLVLVLTVFSPTDLFPRFLREKYVIEYSLKSLPCTLAWLIITFKLMRFQYEKSSSHQ